MSKRVGNVVDPFKTIDQFGADATRWYLITNASPWDSMKFDTKESGKCSENSSAHFIIPTSFLPCTPMWMDLLLEKTISPWQKDRKLTNGYLLR